MDYRDIKKFYWKPLPPSPWQPFRSKPVLYIGLGLIVVIAVVGFARMYTDIIDSNHAASRKRKQK